MESTTSIIIPAFNEEKTIQKVLEAAVNWKNALEIIVISDGSTDKTADIVRKYTPKVKLIELSVNKGKGNALAEGILYTKSEIIVFLDADIVGLRPRDINELVQPVIHGKAEMIIGLHNFWGIGKFRPYNHLSGQRVLWRKRLIPHIAALRQAGGGVEFIINKIHENARVMSIEQSHVYTKRKIDKWSFGSAMQSYVNQAGDFIRAIGWNINQDK